MQLLLGILYIEEKAVIDALNNDDADGDNSNGGKGIGVYADNDKSNNDSDYVVPLSELTPSIACLHSSSGKYICLFLIDIITQWYNEYTQQQQQQRQRSRREQPEVLLMDVTKNELTVDGRSFFGRREEERENIPSQKNKIPWELPLLSSLLLLRLIPQFLPEGVKRTEEAPEEETLLSLHSRLNLPLPPPPPPKIMITGDNGSGEGGDGDEGDNSSGFSNGSNNNNDGNNNDTPLLFSHLFASSASTSVSSTPFPSFQSHL
jgi:hypothetical protein